MSAHAPASLATIRLVAEREVRQRLRTRAFVVATAALCLMIIGGGVAALVVGDDTDTPSYDLAIVGTSPDGFTETLRSVADTLGIEVETSIAASRSEAEVSLLAGELDAAFDVAAIEIVSKEEPPESLAAAIDVAWRSMRSQEAASAAGLDDSQRAEILNPTPPASIVLEPATADDDLAQGVGMAIGVLLFLSINLFGSYVLMGVIEEKSTGVVEVLLGHVRPHQLLSGKVLGLGVVALIQLACTLAAGMVALAISGVAVSADLWIALPATVFWFVGGFVLYNTLFALAGSLVSRVEDAQSATAPISVVFFVAYIAVFTVGSAPGSIVARVMSVLPPFAPLMMPLRIATGSASLAEIVAAGVLLVAAAYGMLRLAGSVYSRTLLHRGSRLHWRQTLRPTTSASSSRAAEPG